MLLDADTPNDIDADASAYRAHELEAAISEWVRQARRDFEARRALHMTNVRGTRFVQDELKAKLDDMLFAYGLKVVRRPNWRGELYG